MTHLKDAVASALLMRSCDHEREEKWNEEEDEIPQGNRRKRRMDGDGEREREGGRRSGDPQTHETTQASSTSSDPSSSPPHIYGGE